MRAFYVSRELMYEFGFFFFRLRLFCYTLHWDWTFFFFFPFFFIYNPRREPSVIKTGGGMGSAAELGGYSLLVARVINTGSEDVWMSMMFDLSCLHFCASCVYNDFDLPSRVIHAKYQTHNNYIVQAVYRLHFQVSNPCNSCIVQAVHMIPKSQ